MVRKSGSSRSVSSNSKSLFDVDFEVVLIVVLIVVAIILICFINKKFNKESFIVSKIREHQREHFTEHSNSNENENANSNANANGSNKKLYLFYATWCGYSRKYLENELPQLTNMLIAANLSDKFLQRDVETPEGKEDASLAGVTGLPSVYKFENGVFTKIDSKNLQAMVDWLSN